MFAVAAWLALVAATAAGSAPSRVDAVRVHGEPSDQVWQSGTPVDAFVERDPTDGGTPSERTEFRVAYNDTTLLVKVRAYERHHDGMRAFLTRRDQDSPSDWIHVFIDSYHDRRTAYEFAVNPAGVKIDRYWYNDTNSDDSWDAVWDVVVSHDGEGWSAEFRIPFSQLRFAPAPSHVFGFAVSRQIGHLNETETWPLLSRTANGYVSSFGDLVGVSLDTSPKKLEVTPYTVASVTTQPTDGNPLLQHAAPNGAVGVDMKYALTPGLTLTATVHPDFGQVEADPAVVNLSAFETFFSERRPFFVEGSGNYSFDFGCDVDGCASLFYSRRIGRAPQGTGTLPSGADVYTDIPGQTAILGAAKLTGRVGRFSIGAMQAVTEDVQARVQNGPLLSSQTVEPRSSYSLGRVRREFANQSSIGFIATAVERQARDGLTDVLPAAATTGGIDWDLRFKSRYSLTGYWVGSSVHGTAPAIASIEQDGGHYFQRPDLRSATLDVTRTALTGDAGQLAIGKIGGEYVRFNSHVSFKSPGFEINDLGFLHRADARVESNWIQVRSDHPNRVFRSRMINFNQYASWNYDGDRLYSGGNVNAHAVFANNWSMGGGYNLWAPGIDDRAARGGPVVAVDGRREFWNYVNSDDRRPLSFGFSSSLGGDGHGTSWRNISPSITYRPKPALLIASSVNVNWNRADAQWVNNVTDAVAATHYVFARLNQTTVSLTERVNFTLTPTLSLQLYAQPFLSGGGYTAFKELADGRSADNATRYAAYAYDTIANGNPDFNVKSLRATNVLRWEYRPGATLFVVWQQARENDAVPGGFNFGRDFPAIFGATSTNIFLVKVAYWLNR